MTDTPERIWLLPEAGSDGETLWCDNPAPGAGMSQEDAVEYVRADLVPQWQPIETAPKDGTRVLLHSPDTHTYTGIAASWCIIDERWEEWDSNHPCLPTHWIPLPAPPKGGA